MSFMAGMFTSVMRTDSSKAGPDFSVWNLPSTRALPEPMNLPWSLTVATPSVCWLLRLVRMTSASVTKARYGGEVILLT